MSAFPLTSKEFPDFDLSTMPAIPAGFDDISWHNDTCPSFVHDEKGLIIFVDYANLEDREWQDGKRFIVGEWQDGYTGKAFVESDDWQEITAFVETYAAPVVTAFSTEEKLALAQEFGRQLQAELSPTKLREVVKRNNAETDSNICHSHDFCDANMVMLEAFKTVFKRESSVSNQFEADLWNEAWAIAKANRFFA